MGGACVVVNLSHQETERGRDHERSLAEVWQELLHQVRNDPCRIVYECELFFNFIFYNSSGTLFD